MGTGVLPNEDTPEFVADVQLAQAFGVHPKVFEDYEPSEVALYTLYLAAYQGGANEKREREAARARAEAKRRR